jgi:ATP-dependent Lon protease
MSSVWSFGAGDRDRLLRAIPTELPILPLRNTVAFPFSMLPLVVGLPRSVKLVEEAMEGNRLIGLFAVHDPEVEEPGPDGIHQVGVAAVITKVVRMQDDSLQVVVHGLERIKIRQWTTVDPYIKAQVEVSPDIVAEGVEMEALRRSLLDISSKVVKLMPDMPNEAIEFVRRIDDPRLLVYLVASNIRIETADAQELLGYDTVDAKFRKLIALLSHELEVLQLGQKIQSEAHSGMEKAQREYFLREQLKAIQKELGDDEGQGSEVEEYRKKIEACGMKKEAKEEADRELDRMSKMSPQSAEYGVIKTYLDWLVSLPWQTLTEDNLDISHARQVLNEDHYDLVEIKDRILEYLAVRKLRKERGLDDEAAGDEDIHRAGGTILCFVGPPGTGKTSLGRSIARALGRKFTRMSLGGVRDEAEIRGHRRTYIGALPGRVIQSLKRVGSRNPVFMLDEVDKIGSDWRGDPASALLEVLDPQQNHAFRDHYLDVDFDLSEVIFICTANMLEPIPAPLRDRMEILSLDGYTEHEKISIAKGYLLPRQIKVNGLSADEIVVQEDAHRLIVREYTREAGVRNLEREIGSVCRKLATKIAEGSAQTPFIVTAEVVREFLGKPRFYFEAALRTSRPGVATGLAVTGSGGDVLFVEAAQMRGHEHLTLTGQLGDVMQESARIALSYVRSHCAELGVSSCFFNESDIHLHVPAGAIPKDGPSAGVTLVTALVSLLTGVPVRSDVGMTGEITLQGQVLPIGGVKQKTLAAHRAGLKTVILPARNEVDLKEVPDDVRAEMRFVLADHIEQVLDVALEKSPIVQSPAPTTIPLSVNVSVN